MIKVEKIKLILLISVLFVAYSCQNKCDKADEVNSGEIIKKIDITWNCSDTPTVCIRNLQEFNDYTQSNNCVPDSESDLPKVDFNKYSILIYHIVEGGCCIFNRDVTVDTTNKIVTYTIEHIHCGCGFIIAMDIWTIDNNMVLVPKIPTDYTIDFKYN